MRRGQTDSSPAFPEIKEQLGYNPARFLVPTDHGMDELSWQTRVKAFIRGMDAVETIRLWQHVEVTLEQGQNGGPRQQVIKWLNHRKAEIGGTDETAPTDSSETPPETVTADTTASTPDTQTPDNGDESLPAGATTSTATEIAADGGAIPNETPICPDCRVELQREVIAGEVGFWCPQCRDFREPATEAAPGAVDA